MRPTIYKSDRFFQIFDANQGQNRPKYLFFKSRCVDRHIIDQSGLKKELFFLKITTKKYIPLCQIASQSFKMLLVDYTSIARAFFNFVAICFIKIIFA